MSSRGVIWIKVLDYDHLDAGISTLAISISPRVPN